MIKYRLKEQGIDIVDTVLTNRGLTTTQINKILNPSQEVVESPYLLTNMKKAIDMVLSAIKENKRIAIPIDSDCDGWCSAGQLYHFIKYTLEYDNVMYFFHEDSKAHGFTNFVVDMLKINEVGLVIMADGGCGDSDRKKYQTILDASVDIVVLDHHPFSGAYQEEVALVNCHQLGENTNSNLSGAGVVFKFLTGLSEELGMSNAVDRYRDVVALSLVSDLMDLKELENRYYLNLGTQAINIVNPFIKKVIEKKKKEGDLTIEELGFEVAPLINSAVRMGKLADKEKIFRCVMGAEEKVESEKRGEKGKGIFVPLEDEAYRIATNLKSAQDKARDKGMAKLLEEEGDNIDSGKVFIADVTEYIDPEISGLVANKILDIVKKPVILLRYDEKKKQYSASVRGLTESKELPSFKKVCLDTKTTLFCAGHENAFGLAVKEEKLEELKEKLNKSLENVEFFTGYEVDYEYKRAIPLTDVKAIAKYEELWCNNIKAPLFVVTDVKLDTDKIDKIGNATYTFKIGDVKFTKNFGSKVWYEETIQQEKLPFGGAIIADIICKFRRNKKGYYYCDIVDMVTRVDEDDIIDF